MSCMMAHSSFTEKAYLGTGFHNGSSTLLQQTPSKAVWNKRGTLKSTALRRDVQFEVDGNWVAPATTPSVKGVCHFLGGAFAGAAPKLAYPLLVDLLRRSGYSVVGTPYAVTFQHDACARHVHERFLECLSALRSSGDTGWVVPADVPVLGVGHSNGALLHLLIGSLCQPANAGNVIISHNNKQVRDAVPIPLDGLRSAVDQIRGQQSLRSRMDTQQFLGDVFGVLRPSGLVSEDTLAALRPALEQFGSVFDEVGDGAVEFSPPPAEVRRIISSSYSVPSTLLVQFENDSIDETPEMAGILRSRPDLDVSALTLPGTHVTPCGGDLQWPVGRLFTPADAVAQALKMVSQAEVRRLAGSMTHWMDARCAAWDPAQSVSQSSDNGEALEGVVVGEEVVYVSANT